jgi:hypothetical protein
MTQHFLVINNWYKFYLILEIVTTSISHKSGEILKDAKLFPKFGVSFQYYIWKVKKVQYAIEYFIYQQNQIK